VRIGSDMFAVVEELKIAVLLDHPGALLSDEGPDDRCGVFVMIEGSIDVAYVVEQRGDDPIYVGARSPCPRGRLKRMPQTSDLLARQRLVEIDNRRQ
jgi:hypothetical protein